MRRACASRKNESSLTSPPWAQIYGTRGQVFLQALWHEWTACRYIWHCQIVEANGMVTLPDQLEWRQGLYGADNSHCWTCDYLMYLAVLLVKVFDTHLIQYKLTHGKTQWISIHFALSERCRRISLYHPLQWRGRGLLWEQMVGSLQAQAPRLKHSNHQPCIHMNW